MGLSFIKKQVQTGLVPSVPLPPSSQIVPVAQEDLRSTGYFHPLQMGVGSGGGGDGGGNDKILHCQNSFSFVQILSKAVKMFPGL